MTKDSVLAIQYALRASGVSLVADGVYGPLTDAATEKSVSPAVRALQREHKLALPVAPSQKDGKVFVSQQELDKAIAKAAAVFGDTVVPFLTLMVRFENYPAQGGVFTTYDGTFKGVAQFSKSTWNLGAKKAGVSLAFEQGVRDLDASMRLAAWYYLDHKTMYDGLKRQSIVSAPYSPDMGYLFHQQGAPAAVTFLKTGKLVYPAQSKVSVAALNRVRQEAIA